MDGATDCAAFDETVVFLRYFKDLEDPRKARLPKRLRFAPEIQGL
jgi:hypothetical protein